MSKEQLEDLTQPQRDRLAFVAQAPTGKGKKAQVFVLSMAGGEAHQITDAPEGVEQFSWSPSGTTICDTIEM